MVTARDIWEAGRKALGLDVPAATAAPPLAAEETASEASDVFDPSAYEFEDRVYRVHFKNGCSGEYSGAVLGTRFPFDPAQIADVRPVEEVGQE
jgi:hypothetical protein